MTEGKTGRLADRLALITGASRGIGAAVAKRFAAEGAHVILLARTVGGLEEVDDAIRADGGQATLVPVDLTDTQKVASLGPMLHERFGKLDVLVANAGFLGALSPVAHSDPKLWQKVFDLNLTANYHLIQTLHPLLKIGPAGRAIFVTSSVARRDKPFWGAYATSKAALEKMVSLYASEVGETPIRVAIIDPGRTDTAMRHAAYPGEPKGTHPAPESVAEIFVEAAEIDFDKNGAILQAQPDN
ncbi:MAG: SDR family NAD(P)-dependent oxidoreductase [Pseudomonadota bacterium]